MIEACCQVVFADRDVLGERADPVLVRPPADLVSRCKARYAGTDLDDDLAAVLDNWDPRVVDGIAASHHVITFDNRGVGASSGTTPTTIEAMAADAVTFIRALGLEQVDLVGFSMGGMIAQVIAETDPQLVRMVLAGTGPAGGVGIDKVTRISYLDIVRGLLTRQDPKVFLFFTRTPNGREPARSSSLASTSARPTATR